MRALVVSWGSLVWGSIGQCKPTLPLTALDRVVDLIFPFPLLIFNTSFVSNSLLSLFSLLNHNHIKSRYTLDNFLLASNWSAMESPDWEQILEMLPVGENEDLEDKRRLPFF